MGLKLVLTCFYLAWHSELLSTNYAVVCAAANYTRIINFLGKWSGFEGLLCFLRFRNFLFAGFGWRENHAHSSAFDVGGLFNQGNI